ncbi:MAG: hypothetical protein SGJ10_05315 [Bacteroidota bacterium]|nr:hypothetical protein [Bacteroidota bacterium]
MPNYIPKAFGISPFLLDYYILSFHITEKTTYNEVVFLLTMKIFKFTTP